MTFHQLQYLAAVQQCGSIRKAAQSLYVSEPAISKSIRELENEFGLTIFERRHDGMVLTRDGEGFMLYAHNILEQFSNMSRKYQHNSEGFRQYIKIAVRYPDMAVQALIDTINDTLPDELFELVFYTASTSEIMDNLVEGSIDMGVVNLLSPYETFWYSMFEAKSLEFIPIGAPQQTYAVIRESHPLAGRDKLAMGDLAPYPFVDTYSGKSSEVSTILGTEARNYIGMRTGCNVICVPDSGSFQAVLNDTNVFSVVGKNRSEEVFTQDGLKYYRVDSDMKFICGVLKNSKRQFSKMEQRFLDFITSPAKKEQA